MSYGVLKPLKFLGLTVELVASPETDSPDINDIENDFPDWHVAETGAQLPRLPQEMHTKSARDEQRGILKTAFERSAEVATEVTDSLDIFE